MIVIVVIPLLIIVFIPLLVIVVMPFHAPLSKVQVIVVNLACVSAALGFDYGLGFRV